MDQQSKAIDVHANNPQPGGQAAVRSPLSFARMDIEKRLSFPAGRFTQPGPILAVTLAVLLSVCFYSLLLTVPDTWFANSFRERGWVPYAIVALSSWALMIVFIKSRKLSLQRRSLQYRAVPDDPDFILSPNRVGQVLERLYEIAEEPKHFVLYNRIQFALSNLKNIGRIGDVDELIRTRAQNDEAAAESSYTIVRGLVWAIPVLGFIGTVIGLSEAIAGFSRVLQETSDIGALRPALQSVTGGLATAFQTTLQALVAALVIQLWMTIVKRSEEQMFDRFNEYCDTQIVGRLRLEDTVITDKLSGATKV